MDPVGVFVFGLIVVLFVAAIIGPKIENRSKS